MSFESLMRNCSALNDGVCSNGFPVKRECILIHGLPPCLDENESARLYPITGSPFKEPRGSRDEP